MVQAGTGENDALSKEGDVWMSLDSVIRCLGINFLLMGYIVCATLIHIAINSSKILKLLEKMDKDKGNYDAISGVEHEFHNRCNRR